MIVFKGFLRYKKIIFPLTPPSLFRRLCRNMKNTAFREKGEAVGWKRFGAASFNRLDSGRQAYENIQFPFNADSQYPKRPAFQNFGTRLPLPHTIGYDTASWGRGELDGEC